MVIFINDKLIRLINKKNLGELHGSDFDTMLDVRLEQINVKKLKGHAIILNASETTFERLLKTINQEQSLDYQSITLVLDNLETVKDYLKKTYKIVKAAGGVVYNAEGKILLIHRLKKWDLPKGKKDEGEKSKQTALREVEEECAIKVKLSDKICTTWHTYTMGNNKMLKKTKWYRMECLDDSEMKPQLEEDIDDLQWFDEKEMQQALLNSYSSIRYVFDKLKH